MSHLSKAHVRADSLTMSVVKGAIVGGGRIGNLLHELNGKQDRLLSREDKILAEESGPIYCCTRNSDLAKIIDETPPNRREDLVFLQNGVLTEFLETKGLSHATQGLIYFAVSKKGEKPIDGITDLNPDGLTAITGKWAQDFKARLSLGGLKCHVLDKETWTVAMLEKHIWICAFMAVGAKHGGITVGEVEKVHNEEVRSLIGQLAHAASIETKVKFSEGVADRLCAYARSVSHFPTALKEFEWRNGWFCDVTFRSVTRMLPDPCPQHSDIMTDQKLFSKARRDWVKRTESKGKLMTARRQQQREIDEQQQYIIKEARAQEAEQRAARGEKNFAPLTPSVTILQKNLTPRIQKLMATHEEAQKMAFEEEEKERQAQLEAQYGGDGL